MGILAKEIAPSTLESFTVEEIEEIRAEARAAIDAQIKSQRRTELLAAFRREELGKVDPTEEVVDLQVDVPGFAVQGITIDGVQFGQGKMLRVTRRQDASLREIMYRAWQHEIATGRANHKGYHMPVAPAPSNPHIGPATVINDRYFARA